MADCSFHFERPDRKASQSADVQGRGAKGVKEPAKRLERDLSSPLF